MSCNNCKNKMTIGIYEMPSGVVFVSKHKFKHDGARNRRKIKSAEMTESGHLVIEFDDKVVESLQERVEV